MKTNRLVAAIMVALALSVVNMRAPVVVPEPPTSLQAMGSVEKFRTWIVTSQMVSVNNVLYYTKTSGELGNWGNFGGKTFSSYSAYQKFTGSNSFKLFNDRRSVMDPTKELRFVVSIAYYIPELIQDDVVEAYFVNTNIGLVSSITLNSFMSPPTKKELAYIRVDGLQCFVVEVRGIYTNSWPAEVDRPAQVPPPEIGFTSFPVELTTNNWVVLNPWYSDGTKDTTIYITAGNKTRKYGRFGEVHFEEGLNQTPLISIQERTMIAASFTRGSTVTIQSTTNLLQNANTFWSTTTNFVDSGNEGYIYIPLTKNKPKEFFRIRMSH